MLKIIAIREKKKTAKINGIFLLIITNKENVEFIKSSKTTKMINYSEIELIENTWTLENVFIVLWHIFVG